MKKILIFSILAVFLGCDINEETKPKCIQFEHIGLRDSIKYKYIISNTNTWCLMDSTSSDTLWVGRRKVNSDLFDDMVEFILRHDTSEDYRKECLIGGYKVTLVSDSESKSVYVADKKSYAFFFDSMWEKFDKRDSLATGMLKSQIQEKYFELRCD